MCWLVVSTFVGCVVCIIMHAAWANISRCVHPFCCDAFVWPCIGCSVAYAWLFKSAANKNLRHSAFCWLFTLLRSAEYWPGPHGRTMDRTDRIFQFRQLMPTKPEVFRSSEVQISDPAVCCASIADVESSVVPPATTVVQGSCSAGPEHHQSD
jgi:hypothetical protein